MRVVQALKSWWERSRRSIIIFSVAILLFAGVFGVLFSRATRVPDDTHVDQRLAQMRRRMEAKRRQREPGMAEIAERIATAPIGRHAQEEWLRETDEP